ncbi:MAG TPA: ABC transporter substrate-binding protein [Pseudonocardiaceae bacterium]|jgi:osmoprotectant transport system substrate-binding protein
MKNSMKAIAGVAAGLAAMLALTACGGSSNPLGSGSSPSGTPSASDGIVIGSANFPESQLLGQIYWQALTDKGIKASQKANLGSREIYFPAIEQGSLDLLPEYTGSLLQYLNKNATQVSSEDVYKALGTTLPSNLIELNQASAQDADAVVVTKATADQYHAKSVTDLAPHCGDLVFGGPPEFITRVDGIPGLKSKYNCTFKSYTQLSAGAVTATALKNGDVQAADIFTTDPSITQYGFVALSDPNHDFAAQNVVPIINKAKATDQVKQVLNAVSAKLDTATLAKLGADLAAPSKPDVSTVAKQWLTSIGL